MWIHPILPASNHVAPVQNKKAAGGSFKDVLAGRVKTEGLKVLAKDAFSDARVQIMGEIDRVCNDTTGNNIDMKTLDELLDLYTANI